MYPRPPLGLILRQHECNCCMIKLSTVDRWREANVKKYLVVALVVLLLAALLAGCQARVNNPVDGVLEGISRSLSGIGDSINRMFENMARGIRFGP